MANWLAATLQVSGGFFHDLVMLRKARKMSFVAASSLGKCPSVLEHLAQLHMQTFNRVGGVDDFSHLRRITVKGNNLLPISAPTLGDHRILSAPGAGVKLAESLGSGLDGFGPVNGLEFARHRLALLPAAKRQAITA